MSLVIRMYKDIHTTTMLGINSASKMISKKPAKINHKLNQAQSVILPPLTENEVMFSAKCSGLQVTKLVRELPSITFFGPNTVQFRTRWEEQNITVKLLYVSRTDIKVFVTAYIKDEHSMMWKLTPAKIQLFENLQRHVQQILGVELNDWQVSALENVMLPLSVTEDRVTKNVRKHGKMTVWGDILYFTLSSYPEVRFKFDVSVEREVKMRALGSASLSTIHKAWDHLVYLIHL